MKDFFGRKIEPGQILVRNGKGNTSAEYGMILYFVDRADEKVSVSRLKAWCVAPYNDSSWQVKKVKSNIESLSSYLIVDPPENIKNFFLESLNNVENLSVEDKTRIAYWLHGSRNLF